MFYISVCKRKLVVGGTCRVCAVMKINSTDRRTENLSECSACHWMDDFIAFAIAIHKAGK